MSLIARHKWFWTATMLWLAVESGSACSVCYGDPDAPMSRGLTWAVVALASMISVVLVGVAGFFVHLNRRGRPASGAKSAPVVDR